MKAKVRTWMNVLLGAFLGMLGYSCSGFMQKYGCPPDVGIDVSGKIIDQKTEQPIENIQVTVKRNGWPYSPEMYSDENGQYGTHELYLPYLDSIDIVARDTAGLYASDSVRIKFNNNGENIQQDFQLKKK
ncbi:MAG: radical SAM-associated putative lipoprotein [Paludibacteraceae bacterium]|nr:radical SAM-associated putative lipoprotein [Paludibacteraceae bacterium]